MRRVVLVIASVGALIASGALPADAKQHDYGKQGCISAAAAYRGGSRSADAAEIVDALTRVNNAKLRDIVADVIANDTKQSALQRLGAWCKAHYGSVKLIKAASFRAAVTTTTTTTTTTTATTTTPRVVTTTPPPKVVYEVTGTGSAVITLQNATGATEQKRVDLPYSEELTRPPNGFLYLSAQLTGSGSVSCKISYGTRVVQEATSQGQRVTVSCSASISG
jgi:hypothetical protein